MVSMVLSMHFFSGSVSRKYGTYLFIFAGISGLLKRSQKPLICENTEKICNFFRQKKTFLNTKEN